MSFKRIFPAIGRLRDKVADTVASGSLQGDFNWAISMSSRKYYNEINTPCREGLKCSQEYQKSSE